MLVARGLKNREIARQLVITYATVQLTKRRIMKKLGVKNRSALVASLAVAMRPAEA
jgi:DNA-binding NarL/FixJ family response regulator